MFKFFNAAKDQKKPEVKQADKATLEKNEQVAKESESKKTEKTEESGCCGGCGGE